VTGLLSGPLVIVVALAMAYARIGSSPAVNAVLDGIAAAAIGLTFATGLQLLPSGSGRLGPLTITLVTVLCVGVLRWPMLPVMLCLGPISVGLALAQPRSGR
jgi:chromate transporter